MFVMMAAVWLPLLVLLLWAMRYWNRPPADGHSTGRSAEREPDARELARRAYARGELDRERFLQLMEDLDRTAD